MFLGNRFDSGTQSPDPMNEHEAEVLHVRQGVWVAFSHDERKSLGDLEDEFTDKILALVLRYFPPQSVTSYDLGAA